MDVDAIVMLTTHLDESFRILHGELSEALVAANCEFDPGWIPGSPSSTLPFAGSNDRPVQSPKTNQPSKSAPTAIGDDAGLRVDAQSSAP